MQFFITFLEGIITFVSPCVLPMLPLYMLYFAGDQQEGRKDRTLPNALGFVAGFTVLFVLLGLFAGTLGGLLTKYKTVVNLVTGAIVVVFGLHYAGLLKIGFLSRTLKPETDVRPTGFFSALLFGVVFAIGWSPCTGAFLGSAMLMAANQASWAQGMLLLLCYSLGLGVPFLLCAVLLDKLKGAFAFIKKHYQIINRVCGAFLILLGILMMTGLFAKLANLLR
jgi:cytochrome c-type biogenesis protein